MARHFVEWLDLPPDARVLEVGCGTGALTRVLLQDEAADRQVLAADPSLGFLLGARSRIPPSRRATLLASQAEHLPLRSRSVDTVVSALVLNFLPSPVAGLREMARCCRGGGLLGAYVWDYTGEMRVLRHFWDAVLELIPKARDLPEVIRFADCSPGPLTDLYSAAGLSDINVVALDDHAVFGDFDDYWQPFLAGQGGAPSYLISLPENLQLSLRDTIRNRLPLADDGSIELPLRIWAIRGRTI